MNSGYIITKGFVMKKIFFLVLVCVASSCAQKVIDRDVAQVKNQSAQKAGDINSLQELQKNLDVTQERYISLVALLAEKEKKANTSLNWGEVYAAYTGYAGAGASAYMAGLSASDAYKNLKQVQHYESAGEQLQKQKETLYDMSGVPTDEKAAAKNQEKIMKNNNLKMESEMLGYKNIGKGLAFTAGTAFLVYFSTMAIKHENEKISEIKVSKEQINSLKKLISNDLKTIKSLERSIKMAAPAAPAVPTVTSPSSN